MPTFKSCYWRLPYTFNSKCGEQVKVISEFNGPLQIPNALLVDFRLYLEDKDTEQQQQQHSSNDPSYLKSCRINPSEYGMFKNISKRI
ncbi:MAG TPA: hypothetical protein VKA87_09035 [Nitrososphaeraceae archaeon]|nr:hypothetical protein [Nitrososphaeraceae archaeon]